ALEGEEETVFASILYEIWRSRNLLVFEGKETPITAMLSLTNKQSSQFVEALRRSSHETQ
ncbi:hypothetical protein SESBI_38290, partial [Sesbania bispinosa]